MARLHSCIRPSINTDPGLSGTNANQTVHGNCLTNSPIIHKKKLKAKHKKNNFKKMVHNPNSSNSDGNYDSVCCKQCKEYCCVIKEESD
jgi:hypothetical protein